MPQHPDHFALVIGVDHYPGYRSLSGAVEDAKDVAAWLVDEGTGGGLPPVNCEVVLSNPNPVRPLQDDIDDALERLVRAAAPPNASKRFYFYFSGHGLARDKLGVDLCLSLRHTAAS